MFSAAIPYLIRLVHGNPWSINKLLTEFREYWRRKESGGQPAENSVESALNTSQSEQGEPLASFDYVMYFNSYFV